MALISKNYLYKASIRAETPLFVFISEKYKLYNSDLYDKKTQGKLEMLTGYFWGKSNKLKDYFSNKADQFPDQLVVIKNSLEKLLE